MQAKQLERFPDREHSSRLGINLGSKYDPYLDGNVWEIPLAETGCATVENLRVSVVSVARRRGLRVRTFPQADSLIIQALPHE